MKSAWALTFLWCAVPCAVSAAADTPPKPDVAFVDASQTSIALQPASADPGKGQATFTPIIRNAGTADATLCFFFQVQDDKNKPVKVLLSDSAAASLEKVCPNHALKSMEVYSYSLQVSPERADRPLSGFVVAEVSAKDSLTALASKPVRLLPPVKTRLSLGLFGVPFGVALACILLASFLVAHFGFFSRMGNVTWDFSQSWASNLTIAGSALTTLLGFSGLAEYGKYLSKNSYLSLSFLFGALVTLAPAVYNFTRRTITVPIPDPDDPNNVSGVRIEGYVFSFLLASFVTVWAVLGQLLTIAFVLAELVDLGPLPSSAGIAFTGVIVLLVVLLLVYTVVTIRVTVKKQVIHHQNWLKLRKAEAASQVRAASEKAHLAAPQIETDVAKASAAIDQQKPVLPKWPLL